MKHNRDECWEPLPGSWEEAVETYEEQRIRWCALYGQDLPCEVSMTRLAEVTSAPVPMQA